MMNVLPLIQPQITVEQQDALPLYKEVKWDRATNTPIWQNGSPVIVLGKEAVLSWAFKTLHTERFRYEIYSWNHGNEMYTLIGQAFTEEIKISEAARYVEECLLVNPYIRAVKNITVDFTDDVLSIACELETIYGNAEIRE